MKRISVIISALIVTLAVTGCTTQSPRPESLLTQVESRVEHAKSVDSQRHAPVVLRDAQKNLDRARALMSQEEYDRAELHLEKAMADANLAIATSNAAKSEKAAEQVEENLRALEREMQ